MAEHIRLYSDRGYIDRQHQAPWDKLMGKEKREMRKGLGGFIPETVRAKSSNTHTTEGVECFPSL